MSKQSFVIYGAGGHAKVIVDLVWALGGNVACIFDDQPESLNFELMGVEVRRYDVNVYPEAEMIIAVGHNESRQAISRLVHHRFATLIHPRASVSKLAKVREGTVVLANAVIQAEAVIGKHVIVNAGACIDHEVEVQDFAHIGPLVYVGGAALIAAMANIRPGALIKRMVKIPYGRMVEPNEIVQ